MSAGLDAPESVESQGFPQALLPASVDPELLAELLELLEDPPEAPPEGGVTLFVGGTAPSQ